MIIHPNRDWDFQITKLKKERLRGARAASLALIKDRRRLLCLPLPLASMSGHHRAALAGS